jgi:hypothetical protein
MNVARTNFINQRCKPGFYVFNSALSPPVTLGRKIDNVLRIRESTSFEDEHAARLHLVAVARGGIGPKILRERILKLKSDSAAHNTHAVYGINQGLDVFSKNVPSFVFDHSISVH